MPCQQFHARYMHASSPDFATSVGPSSTDSFPSELPCTDAVQGDACWNEVKRAMHDDFPLHPERYPGLTASSSSAEFQAFVHGSLPDTCHPPCFIRTSSAPSSTTSASDAPLAPAAPLPGRWCGSQASAPRFWKPKVPSTPTSVKVLSYNLFWWSLFKARNGNGNSAGKLIKNAMDSQPFDFMGFQECEDPQRVLAPVELTKDYEAFLGGHAICMAYRKSAWKLLDHGQADVAEDMPTRYYGKRGTQWMRLQHRETGLFALFANHHGPLSINSGGVCGGPATAKNIMQLMRSKAQDGDLLVLVGDFNANAAGFTVQSLWPYMTHVYNGDSFGGVDNVFSNADVSMIAETRSLGSGGSDHNAISAVLQVGGQTTRSAAIAPMPSNAVAVLMGKGTSGPDWTTFWCGTVEMDTLYTIEAGAWSMDVTATLDHCDPDRCCRACQQETRCQAFRWINNNKEKPQCQLHGGAVVGRRTSEASVSGLPAASAARVAATAAATAAAR